ncbi:MAG: hypothetical protein WC089_02185 [Candidatus Paceibacterota bacterium]
MILRNIYFLPAQGASGVQGFFGDPRYPEYKHSGLIRATFGDIFHGMGFVSKTGTYFYNKGNVELDRNGYSFKRFAPDAIRPFILRGAALNAVGLSNPGYEKLLKTGLWFERTDPFMLSFMAVENTVEKRIAEAELFVEEMANYLGKFRTQFALQVNLSCPNVGHEQHGLIAESYKMFEILNRLRIPLVPKINALLDPGIAFEIMDHPACDALCVSNTIPFGQGPSGKIDWSKYGPKGKSPLERKKYPPGGLSGAPIFPLVVDWLRHASELKNSKPIIAGGGVMDKESVEILAQYPNVEAISIGSVAFLRPGRVRGIIKQCYKSIN